MLAARLERNPTEIGDRLWRGHRRHDHDLIDRFPALVLLPQVLVDYLAEHWPHGRTIDTWHRRPEQQRLYDYVRPRLEWLGERGSLWKLTDELVGITTDIMTSRTAEFVFDVEEPRPMT